MKKNRCYRVRRRSLFFVFRERVCENKIKDIRLFEVNIIDLKNNSRD